VWEICVTKNIEGTSVRAESIMGENRMKWINAKGKWSLAWERGAFLHECYTQASMPEWIYEYLHHFIGLIDTL